MIDLELLFILECDEFLDIDDEYEINLESNYDKLDDENYVKQLINSGQYNFIINNICINRMFKRLL